MLNSMYARRMIIIARDEIRSIMARDAHRYRELEVQTRITPVSVSLFNQRELYWNNDENIVDLVYAF